MNKYVLNKNISNRAALAINFNNNLNIFIANQLNV